MAEGSPTNELATFASNLTYAQIPDEVTAHAKRILLDTIGCGIYGSKLPWGEIIADYVREIGGKEEATVWGHGFQTSAANAALANSTMVHGFELDDLHKNAGLHGGGLTTSDALGGAAEERGSVSGKEFITAIVAGYEVSSRMGMCMGTGKYSTKGFRLRGTNGAFASAVASGKSLI